MSGDCFRNCDLDCHPRYKGMPHPLMSDGIKIQRLTRRNAVISAAIRAKLKAGKK